MHDAYIGGFSADQNKASDAAENLQLYRVVRFFHSRSSCTTMHISADVQRITLNASCMTISGGRTEQLDIFCHVTGFKSDFLSFIVAEIIRFFQGALQLLAVQCFLNGTLNPYHSLTPHGIHVTCKQSTIVCIICTSQIAYKTSDKVENHRCTLK